MARYSSMPDRDEQGRFMSEDDRGHSRGGGYRGGQERDEGSRYMSEGSRRSRGRYEDEDEGRYGGGRRSMGREYDEDERRSSSRGRDHGGWFGDSEGHSEASRRGWSGPTTAKAAGSAIPAAIPKLLAAAGETQTTAKAAGSATGKAIPRLLAAAGRKAATAHSVARRTTTGVIAAGRAMTTTMAVIAAVRATRTKTAAMRADAAAATKTTSGPNVDAAMAVGPAIRKATPRRRGAVGSTGADPGASNPIGRSVEPPCRPEQI